MTIEDIKDFEFRADTAAAVCISQQDTLRAVSWKEAQKQYYDLLLDRIGGQSRNCRTIVELGAGYGYNLWLLSKLLLRHSLLGGEYCSNAVDLASHLYPPTVAKIVPFNFYDHDTYCLLDRAESPVLVFTCHAMEQLPSARSVLDSLFAYRDKIGAVLHFEPLYESHGANLLGLMRRRYTEINDYNRDLLDVLRQRSYVRIVKIEENILGLNPLNPTSILHWEFV
ncbi:MAG: hypothetical protein HY649_02730 [Acidobacteria bacterium]|nr:hypothetical protein [Acidobacteriota bacterium]